MNNDQVSLLGAMGRIWKRTRRMKRHGRLGLRNVSRDALLDRARAFMNQAPCIIQCIRCCRTNSKDSL